MSELRVDTITDEEGTGSPAFPNGVNIDGGNIDGTPIGVSSASSGAFSTLTASGDVGIGTMSPISELEVNGTVVSTSSDVRGDLIVRQPGAVSRRATFAVGGSAQLEIMADAGNFTGNSYLSLGVDGSERMRIDSSGNVLIGKTSANAGGSVGHEFRPMGLAYSVRDAEVAYVFQRNTTGGDLILFRKDAGNTVGSISVTGSSTAYNTSSDYRLKENAQPITGALAKVQALNPVCYNWKADGSEGEGFIAHELQEVVPYAVSGEKDGEEMQAVDYGKLTTLLTAAIKELKAELDELKGA